MAARAVMGKREDSRLHDKICQGILTGYFLAMTCFYPFYMTDGYLQIGKDKYFFYRNISLAVLLLMGVLLFLSFIVKDKKEILLRWYQQMSVTDWFAYSYLLVVLLSYLCAPYRDEVLWGTEGWYMGTATQLIFVLFYFLFSRYFIGSTKWLLLWMISSAGVFCLAVLNRYSVYPIEVQGQTPTFISTLGNINWFSGYWAVVCPMGVISYWNSRSFAVTGRSVVGMLAVRLSAGIFCIVAFLAGITQGSSSAFLVFAVVFYFVFWISFRGNRSMYAFLELGLLFVLSCLLGGILRQIPSWKYNYETKMGNILTDSGIMIGIGVIGILFYLLLRALECKRGFCIENHKGIRKGVTLCFILAFPVYLALAALNSCMDGGLTFLSGNPFFTLNESWGNSRGTAWSVGIDAYLALDPLHKIVGIGADSFAPYCYSVPELAGRLVERFGNARLTNAHNEWLTVLVNFGAAGLLCYAGIFLSAIRRFLGKAKEQPLLYACTASVIAYTVHNTVSFQHVLNTPFVFLVLGIGEGLLRKTAPKGITNE